MSENAPKRRFRWRIIPAGFLMCMGGMMFLICTVGFLAVVVFHHQGGVPSSSSFYRALAGLGLQQAASLFLFAAGWLILRRRWGWMTLALLIGYAAGVYGTKLMEDSRGPSVPLYRISDLGS